ncbi:MAG: isoamylase early set domain-containing protein [Deltaproteobacteria bacterium]|nr:isoamylase early set domain-containing protein [Deltaproteobacteria bacterium]
MSVIKQYLKKKGTCKITFILPTAAAEMAKSVNLVGEMNDWDITATPMKKGRDGSFKVTLELQSGREYQYRYLINGDVWENDWEADRYVPSPFTGSENSVVAI